MRFAGANIAGFMSERPNFGELGSFGMEARSSERQTNSAAEGLVAQSGLDSMAKIKEAKYQAEGIEAQGAANAAATRAQGMSSMISGIAGGIGKMSFGGGAATGGYEGSMNVPGFGAAGDKSSFQYGFGAGGGSVGGYGTLGPNFGYPSP